MKRHLYLIRAPERLPACPTATRYYAALAGLIALNVLIIVCAIDGAIDLFGKVLA